MITVIATGFEKSPVLKKPNKLLDATPVSEPAKPVTKQPEEKEDDGGLDIPIFLKRNRFR